MTNSATNSDMNRRSTAVGVFNDRSDAREAVQELRNAGFRDDQIGFAARNASTTTLSAQGDDVGAGVASGAVTGGILGGIIGAAAALLIPGIGPVVAGGVLATAIGGAAVGAAAGGLLGALVAMGVPEEEARYYDQEFRSGRTIVTVQAGNRYQEAEAILRRCGASFAQSGTTGTDSTSTSATTTQERTLAGARPDARETTDTAYAQDRNQIRVPEVEERLEVDKRPTQEGEVRLHKTVREEEQTVPVEVMHEEVHVERRDVDRPLKPGEQAFQEGTIRVPVRGEEVVAHKEAVVTGEVVVNKERTTEHQEVSDTVRRTEVHVDRADETVYPDHQEAIDADSASSRSR